MKSSFGLILQMPRFEEKLAQLRSWNTDLTNLRKQVCLCREYVRHAPNIKLEAHADCTTAFFKIALACGKPAAVSSFSQSRYGLRRALPTSTDVSGDIFRPATVKLWVETRELNSEEISLSQPAPVTSIVRRIGASINDLQSAHSAYGRPHPKGKGFLSFDRNPLKRTKSQISDDSSSYGFPSDKKTIVENFHLSDEKLDTATMHEPLMTNSCEAENICKDPYEAVHLAGTNDGNVRVSYLQRSASLSRFDLYVMRQDESRSETRLDLALRELTMLDQLDIARRLCLAILQ
ncbi:hypothetical protein LTR66_005246 [Elasticomyces elasticus]|nr:hypothetical protein LTR66_005246 [Elasticomyces elasticus]